MSTDTIVASGGAGSKLEAIDSSPDYSKKTKAELVEECKTRGLKGYSSKNKTELIKLLLEGKSDLSPKKKLLKEDTYTEDILKERYEDFYNNYKKTSELKTKYNLPIRQPNMPEDISENIAKFIIKSHEKKDAKWSKCIDKSGDLYSCDDNKHLEIKTFMSDGPISFGPSEAWDDIYFLDARQIMDGIFALYKLPYSNTSTTWRNVKVNNTDTFEKHASEKRRPRQNWESIKTQLDDKIEKIFEGLFSDIFAGASGI
jgi:hypothetical protein